MAGVSSSLAFFSHARPVLIFSAVPVTSEAFRG